MIERAPCLFLYLFSSCGIFTAEAVQSQFYKTSQGAEEVTLNLAVRDRERNASLAAVKAFIMNDLTP